MKKHAYLLKRLAEAHKDLLQCYEAEDAARKRSEEARSVARLAADEVREYRNEKATKAYEAAGVDPERAETIWMV